MIPVTRSDLKKRCGAIYLVKSAGTLHSNKKYIQDSKLSSFFGNHSQDPDEKCQRTDLPVVHPNTNFGFELSLDENVPVHVERVCFQVVLHYTTPIGQNRTRIHTVAVPVTDSLLAVAKSVDQQCLAAYLTKLTAEELLTFCSGTFVSNGTV